MAFKTHPWWIIESLYTASTRALPPFLPLLPTVPPPAFKMVLPYTPFIQVCRFVPFTHSYSQLPPIALMKVIIDSMHTVDLHWVNLLAALAWSGLPCPPPGDLPDPGIGPTSRMSPALAGGFFTTSGPWEDKGYYFMLSLCLFCWMWVEKTVIVKDASVPPVNSLLKRTMFLSVSYIRSHMINAVLGLSVKMKNFSLSLSSTYFTCF